ncbi:MAG TPA: sulfatase-like hydrolase/transferase [Gemmataceae bacterium]|nr:sulfatase-like hydrolase/transferase [Gemmataceae bacterium]
MSRQFLAVSLFVTLLGGSAHAADRPNIVLILADDLGWADLGCYGSKYHKTPHLDRLAAGGLRFTDAYAACPVCSPTRASLLTGRYPQRYNLTDWLPGRPDRPDQKLLRPKINQQLPLEEITLPEALKPAGYVSGHIGKWHLGGKGFGPEQQGFDLNIAGDQTGTARSYFAPFKSRDGTFMPGLEKAPDGEYLTDRLTAEAEKFIEANRERPFFLYLAHYAPHIPLRAKPELVARYKPGKHGEQGNPNYAAMLESLDDGVGRVLKKLDDLKLADRTIVLFMSDNGGLATLEGSNMAATFNGPLREGKGYLYEGGIRVPLIVRWPGVTKAGTTCSVPVCSIDFFPTALEACGVKCDAKVDGLSLIPLFRGGKLEREALYWHYPHYANQGSRPGAAARAGAYKLIEFYENGRRELYDLDRDVGETRNLVADKPDVARELGRKLDAWRKDVGARMMAPNPDYVPNPQAKDGTVTLAARTAEVHGLQLRYEPLPHKDTLGFWTRADDWASWEFTVTKPGTFSVEVLQGCGKGQGGSAVEAAVGDQVVKFTVEDTGGFQSFKAREVGTVKIDKAGRHTLTIKATKKAAAAVMDLRSVMLRPADG